MCFAIVLLVACIVDVQAGLSLQSCKSSSINFGKQLAMGWPFKSVDPHHKQIITDKDLISNKGIDSHAGDSELVQLDQLGALVHLDGTMHTASTKYSTSTPSLISSSTTPASSGDDSEVRVILACPFCVQPLPCPGLSQSNCCCPSIVKRWHL